MRKQLVSNRHAWTKQPTHALPHVFLGNMPVQHVMRNVYNALVTSVAGGNVASG
jgi:hypothetical protein